MHVSNEEVQNNSSEEDEFSLETKVICDKIAQHVYQCETCKRRLSFDPIEKSLLKTHSVRSEIFELIAFIIFGIIVIVMLYFIINM